MSYQEKRTIVSFVTEILILAAYCIYALGQYQSGAAAQNDLKFWAGTIVAFICIQIIATIIIQIVFHILLSISIAVQKSIKNENCAESEIDRSIKVEMTEDEMNKLISLKSMRFNSAFFGVGFLAGLVALLLNYSAAVMLNIMFVAFLLSSLFGFACELYYYRKGV